MRILILPLIFAAFLAAPAVGQDQPPLPELFKDRNPLTTNVLEADFPADLEALDAYLTEADKPDMIELQKLSASFDAMTVLRKKYADRLLFAPPAALGRMLVAAAEFYEAVLKGEGAATCGVFAQDGAKVLFSLGKSTPYAALLDQQSAAFFEAVVQAIETPEANGAVQTDDWTVVLGTMVGRGAPERYVLSVAKGDSADPDLCPALAAMFRAAAALDTPEGLRARADMAKTLVGY